MKNIFRRKVGSDYHWGFRCYVNGKQIRRTYPTKEEAKKELAILKGKVAIGESLAPKDVLFEVVAQDYLDYYSKGNKRSWKRDEGMIKNLKEFFKGKSLSQIIPENILQYRIYRKKNKPELSDSTLNREETCLGAIFKYAIINKRFKGEIPTKFVKKYSEDNTQRRCPTEEVELAKMFGDKYTSQNAKNIFLCAITTGLRVSDICKLKWSQINWKERKIPDIIQEKTRQPVTIFIPKNSKLEKLLTSMEYYEYCPYVFTNNGKQIKSLSKTFGRIRRDLGIKDKKLTMTASLRTYFATTLGNLGYSELVIDKLLGHKPSKKRIVNRYVTIGEEILKEATRKLDKALPEFILTKTIEPLLKKRIKMGTCFRTCFNIIANNSDIIANNSIHILSSEKENNNCK